MTRKTVLSALSAALLTVPALRAQESWTLKRCIDYAVENNITVQQLQVNSENQEIRLNTSRNSRLPNLNASFGENVSFGRGAGRDDRIVDNTQISTSIGASANVTVFEGMRIRHDIAGRQFDLKAAMKDLERAKEDVSLNVTSLFLQVLLNKELVKVAENQVALSDEQVARSEQLVKSGKSPDSELYESRALLANDQLSLTQARNTLRLSLLDLSQALNLEDKEGFDIQSPDFGSVTLASMSIMESPRAIYDYAVGNRPAVLAEEFRLQSSRKALQSARSALYPSISLGVGYNNGYYHSISEAAQNISFFKQLKNNGSEYIGLNLNIPIFNRLATRNNIRIARNNIKTQELTIAETRLKLRKEIEQCYYNADAAYQKFLASEKSFEAAREAFRYQEEKTEAGRSTIFDYNDARTRMIRSESEMLQAKFDFIFRRKILDFYVGKPLDSEF